MLPRNSQPRAVFPLSPDPLTKRRTHFKRDQQRDPNRTDARNLTQQFCRAMFPAVGQNIAPYFSAQSPQPIELLLVELRTLPRRELVRRNSIRRVPPCECQFRITASRRWGILPLGRVSLPPPAYPLSEGIALGHASRRKSSSAKSVSNLWVNSPLELRQVILRWPAAALAASCIESRRLHLNVTTDNGRTPAVHTWVTGLYGTVPFVIKVRSTTASLVPPKFAITAKAWLAPFGL